MNDPRRVTEEYGLPMCIQGVRVMNYSKQRVIKAALKVLGWQNYDGIGPYKLIELAALRCFDLALSTHEATLIRAARRKLKKTWCF